MSQVKTEGYIFKSVNYNETSRIFHLFSKDFGVIPILARGILKSGLSNENFDLFSKSTFVLYEPHSGEIYKYKESELLGSGIEFSKNIRTFYRISLIFKILSVILPKNVPVRNIYDMSDKVITKIRKFATSEENKYYVIYFLLNLLRIEGYGLDYLNCKVCKKSLSGQAYYSPKKSALICPSCNLSDDNILLNSQSLELIKNLSNGNFKLTNNEYWTKSGNKIWRILSLSYSSNLNFDLGKFEEFIK